MDLNPDDARAATIRAVASFRVGRREEGLHWGSRAVDFDPQDAGVAYNVACLFAVAGERERALDLLEEAVAAGFGNREWLERDPDLQSIRDDPRFAPLLGSLADPEEAGSGEAPAVTRTTDAQSAGADPASGGPGP